MPFALSHRLNTHHLFAIPADLALEPPESYCYIQDGLIILCALFWTLSYIFYALRTYGDGVLAAPVEFMGLTMGWELYYALALPPEGIVMRVAAMAWFAFDAGFVMTAIFAVYERERREMTTRRVGLCTLAAVAALWLLGERFPDEAGKQMTAYWTGLILQVPISLGSLWILLSRGDTRGQSLEIWITRYIGTVAAYAVFVWRYLNVPENWAYVGSTESWILIIPVLIVDTAYPVLYIYMHHAHGRQQSFTRPTEIRKIGLDSL